MDELNEPRPSMQWRFDPDHPPTNSDPATSCNLVIVGIVMMTMMMKIVTMMMVVVDGVDGDPPGNHWGVPPIKIL